MESAVYASVHLRPHLKRSLEIFSKWKVILMRFIQSSSSMRASLTLSVSLIWSVVAVDSTAHASPASEESVSSSSESAEEDVISSALSALSSMLEFGQSCAATHLPNLLTEGRNLPALTASRRLRRLRNSPARQSRLYVTRLVSALLT
jgi:hypothetical protein